MRKVYSGFGLVVTCVLAFAVPTCPALAQTVDAVEQAIADHSLNKAGVALNQLVEARLPSRASAGPDTLLDRLYVDLAAANGASASSLPLIQRLVAQPSTPNRGHYRLLLGVAQEERADLDAAEQTYRALMSDQSASAESKRDALLAVARLQMATDPRAATATLMRLSAQDLPKDAAWEVDLLRARAAAMTGVEGTSQLDTAWSEAAAATLTQAAPARVSIDRAVVAGRARDRKTLVAMLAVDRYDRGTNDGQAGLAADLPLCGTAGIGPQDRVILDVAHVPAVGRPKATLVWASRPGIAKPFLVAAARSGSLTVNSGQAAAVELACRSVPSSDYVVRNTLEEATAAGTVRIFVCGRA